MSLRFILSALLFLFSLSILCAAQNGGEVISGNGFKGVICTPAMVHATGLKARNLGNGTASQESALWTPTAGQIQKAEADFAAFLHKMTIDPVRGSSAPTYYSSKHSSTLARYDRDILYEMANSGPYERQYIGLTEDGKKSLIINFVFAPVISEDKLDWRNKWFGGYVDGGSVWVQLQYSLENGTFTGWENWG